MHVLYTYTLYCVNISAQRSIDRGVCSRHKCRGLDSRRRRELHSLSNLLILTITSCQFIHAPVPGGIHRSVNVKLEVRKKIKS